MDLRQKNHVRVMSGKLTEKISGWRKGSVNSVKHYKKQVSRPHNCYQ